MEGAAISQPVESLKVWAENMSLELLCFSMKSYYLQYLHTFTWWIVLLLIPKPEYFGHFVGEYTTKPQFGGWFHGDSGRGTIT